MMSLDTVQEKPKDNTEGSSESADIAMIESVNSISDLLELIDRSQSKVQQKLSENSQALDQKIRSHGVKRKFLDILSKGPVEDKRFCHGFNLNQSSDFKPAFSIQFHPKYFKFSKLKEHFSYDGVMSPIPVAIKNRELIPEIMDILDISQAKFYDGCICVAITDYRNCSKKKFNFSGRKDDLTACNDSSKEFESFKVLLKPTYASLLLDQKLIQTSFQFDDDFMLDLESKYLAFTETNICLDPSPKVTLASNLIEYNKQKMRAIGDRYQIPQKHEASTELDEMDILMEMNPQCSSNINRLGLGLMNVVENWREKKKQDDARTLRTLESKEKGGNVAKDSASSNLIRTLKYMRKARDKTYAVYTTLNIYQLPNGNFEVILRWGNKPDTSVNGNMLRFQFSNFSSLQSYLNTFNLIYSQCESHLLAEDNKSPTRDLFSNSGAQQHHLLNQNRIPSQSNSASIDYRGPNLNNTPNANPSNNSPSPIPHFKSNPQDQSFANSRGQIVKPTSVRANMGYSISSQLYQEDSKNLNQSNDSTAVNGANPSVSRNNTTQNTSFNPSGNLSQGLIQHYQLMARQLTQEQLHQLMSTPYEKVPSAHKELYVFIRNQIKKRRQNQEAMAAALMAQQRMQQQQQTTNSSLKLGNSPISNLSRAHQQALMRQNLLRQQLMQNQGIKPHGNQGQISQSAINQQVMNLQNQLRSAPTKSVPNQVSAPDLSIDNGAGTVVQMPSGSSQKNMGFDGVMDNVFNVNGSNQAGINPSMLSSISDNFTGKNHVESTVMQSEDNSDSFTNLEAFILQQEAADNSNDSVQKDH